jgi:glycosyltransferase involved in cell wall biosynthesis
MACIIRVPTPGVRGVLTVTTQERDQIIVRDPAIQEALHKLKAEWAIGLHHNWHDFNFAYNPLFDFSMAGEEDLRESSGRAFSLIPFDACNFVPASFRPTTGEKFWDVLFVARAVYFKRIPEFFRSIRDLYDSGERLRILFICPVPPFVAADESTAFYGIRALYEKMFSDEEQDRFTLLTIDYRYPFPLDLQTLSFFYRASRVFVHSADDERRCRVAAYAWASGLPVVGMRCIGSLLPPRLRQPPLFFEAANHGEFPQRILEALESTAGSAQSAFESVRREVSAAYTVQRLLDELVPHTGDTAWSGASAAYATDALDLRLGRHHGLGTGPNNVGMSLGHLVEVLGRPDAVRDILATSADPERSLAIRYANVPLQVRDRRPSDGNEATPTGWLRRLPGRIRHRIAALTQ